MNGFQAGSNATVSRRRTAQRTNAPHLSTGIVLVALAMLPLLGCASAATHDPVARQTPADGRHAQLVVANHHRHEVLVSVVPEGSPIRLGTVDATDRRAFRVPQYLNGVLAWLLIRCVVDGELHATREVEWGPRQRVDLSVQPYLNLSQPVIPR